MGIESKLSNDNRVLTISPIGRFDCNLHQSFRRTYESMGNGVEMFVIDFKDVNYLDSSALGSLLLLREYGRSHEANIEIINSNDEVKEVLDIAHFGSLFTIK